MNSLYYTMQINQLSNRFRQIANTPNVLNMQFTAVDVAGIRESTIAIANECKANDPQIARQLLAAKDILFGTNQFGQTFINPSICYRGNTIRPGLPFGQRSGTICRGANNC